MSFRCLASAHHGLRYTPGSTPGPRAVAGAALGIRKYPHLPPKVSPRGGLYSGARIGQDGYGAWNAPAFQEGWSNSVEMTVRNVRAVLRAALNQAVKRRRIPYNVATLVEIPRAENCLLYTSPSPRD